MARDVSLAEMARSIEPGESAYIPGCTAEPVELTDLIQRDEVLAEGVHFTTSFAPGINTRKLCSRRRTMGVFMMQPALSDDHAKDKVIFHRMRYSVADHFLGSGDVRIDTAIVQVAAPDAQGRCSLGPSVEFTPTVLGRCARIFAVINPWIPALPGSPSVSLDDVDLCTHSEVRPAEYSAGASNPVTQQIVKHLASMIPDGATLQLGLGKIPAHLQSALAGHRGLRLHSGMLSDYLLDLVGSASLAPSPIVAAVVVGSAALYAHLPAIPQLRVSEVSMTHSAERLAGLPRFHAINTALDVDLRGCVNAEMVDGFFVSGPGGLPDFARAARTQGDGLSIIALPSTGPRGKRSRILTRLPDDSSVTVPGEDVDVIVSEHGVADLRGLNDDARARAIADIAHPTFRSSLLASLNNIGGRQSTG